LSKYDRFLFIAMVLVITLFMLINTRETVASAASGLKLWYTAVLPVLLPFFVEAELLVGLGLLH